MDTIAAIATPPGSGGIGIVRISGPDTKAILGQIFLPRSGKFVNFRPWTLHHGVLLDGNDEPLDDALAVFMPGPHTYTGEDVGEIHCHGGSFMMQAALQSVLRLGARAAQRGEFTRRAFLNGRMDLSQAEAVGELIGASGREAARLSLDRLEGKLGAEARELSRKIDDLRIQARLGVDFPEEEIDSLDVEGFRSRLGQVIRQLDSLLAGAERARLLNEGAMVVLAGPVNAGKSSLLNALSGRNRALVTPEPGTTRDYIEERLDFDGFCCRLIDTAGLRSDAENAVEAAGIAKSHELISQADLVVFVSDSTEPVLFDEDVRSIFESKPSILVCNKSDLAHSTPQLPEWAQAARSCHTSAVTGENIDALGRLIRSELVGQAGMGRRDGEVAPNVRQAEALKNAREELVVLDLEIPNGLTYDCWLTRLDGAASALEDILTLMPEDALLDRIFSSFCIGK